VASVIKKFPIGKSRFRSAVMDGFAWSDSEGLLAEGAGGHVCFLSRIDSGHRSCQWGRLRFTSEAEEDAIPVIHAFATDDELLIAGGETKSYDEIILDENETALRKRRLFEMAGASKFVGKNDVLLYEQEGRYLWLCVEVVGHGRVALRDFEVFAPRDNFFTAFPEIYRTNGEFFHRYLAIFSSMYYDLQDVIDSIDRLIDVDAAPEAVLPVLAEWLGIEIDGGFVEEAQFRKVLKLAFEMIRAKGTREAVEKLLRVFLDEGFYIVEQRAAREAAGEGEGREISARLYGDSPFDFTVLIRKAPEERLHARLKYLIRQFAPLRTRANIVFLENTGRLDAYAYCDVNARVAGFREGRLDLGATLDGTRSLH
jgi:phage tail-like protein